MKKALTDILVRSIPAPASGRVEISDLRCTGLELRVSAKDARSWSFRFRDPQTGRVSRATLGSYPDVTLSQARTAADDMRRTVAAGRNPVEEKRRARLEATTNTFQALSDRYIKERARRFKRSADADERNLRLHILPKWKDRPYASIERRDIIALCEGMVQHGKATQANRIQALISSIFSFAIDADLVRANPCHRLRKRGVETVATRVLSDAEVKLFWNGVTLPPVSRRVGLALRLLLLTGARAGEVAGALRSEFESLDDPARAGWVIPADRSKNGRAHFVPLSPLAVGTINDALTLVGKDEAYLFPSPSVDEVPITAHALAVAMARFGRELKEMEDDAAVCTWQAEPPSPHDLRRTIATRLASLGIPGEDVSAVLNHIRRDVTGRHYDTYDRAREKRIALELWARTVEQIVAEKANTSTVVIMKPKRAAR
ncbi:integrase arm-type DNA-binding domain-containing protein [Microvirga mediterraneensis]|uniref:Integrase arm-type DNA-binding domain-containing protein n=1 Tax=Microvirga mediterraneensis TaxID=2754695 RepID=A0A838BSU7_9HYPH|nr:integrase arm-type DNA-binding domain-containing protein [Microvirga mediterraneensis]